jgi:aspartyl protease family protein
MAQGGTIFGACLLGGLAVLAARELAHTQASQPPVEAAPAPGPAAAPPSAQPVGNGLASVTLNRASDSHFYADVQVNGATIRFLVDTGATGIVLTAADAQRAGIGGGDYNAVGKGAGGEVRMMPTTATRLALGPLNADNVPVMVAKEGLSVSLLGQSYLSRIGSVTISGDRMILQ